MAAAQAGIHDPGPKRTPCRQRTTVPDESKRYCRSCFYDLEGNVTNRCPECGQDFDFSKPWTISRFPRPFRPITVLLPALAVLGTYVLLNPPGMYFRPTLSFTFVELGECALGPIAFVVPPSQCTAAFGCLVLACWSWLCSTRKIHGVQKLLVVVAFLLWWSVGLLGLLLWYSTL